MFLIRRFCLTFHKEETDKLEGPLFLLSLISDPPTSWKIRRDKKLSPPSSPSHFSAPPSDVSEAACERAACYT